MKIFLTLALLSSSLLAFSQTFDKQIDKMANTTEKQVIDWLNEMMGFPPTASGLLTSGASMANFTALTVARNANSDPAKGRIIDIHA